jgi:5'-nucleotidase
MNILISNDDGYMAPGIKALADALAEFADITVVAPDRNRSGASNSLTLDNPLRVNQLENGYYRVEGTPTDCVHLAITGLLDQEPDMVVSGINAGANLGDDVLYSGTVAAATEGRFLGLPAVAISLTSHTPEHFETAAWAAKKIVQQLKKSSLPANTILNVNVPDIPIEDIIGFESTRLGNRHKAEPVIKEVDPRGRPLYWVGPAGDEQDAGPGTDFDAIRRGAVSVTPLQIDLTRFDAIDRVANWLQEVEL